MTTLQLSNKIRLQFANHGHYYAFVNRNNKEVKLLITDMTLIDTIKSGESCFGTTVKQALQIIWNKSKTL